MAEPKQTVNTSLKLRENYLAFGQPDFGSEEEASMSRVVRSGWVGMGPETIAFEQELQSYVGAPHVVTVNSCTSALFLSLLSLGIKEGDEVICPSMTWCSTANAALYLGATPVFCDIDQETLCVTIESIQAQLTPRTRAVVVVHLGGLSVDVKQLRAALPENIVIIEDAAHAMGARYPDGSMVGSSGNLTCFSFYANKNLSTGEGGAVAVFDDDIANHIRSLRQHGLSSDAWKRFTDPKKALVPGINELGYKMNYTDMQAALGRVQLKRLNEMGQRRLAIAKVYTQRLAQMSLPIGVQADILDEGHARHLYLIKLPIEQMKYTRDELLLALRDRNIGACIHYVPLHSMPFYQPQVRGTLPNTEYLAGRIMTLPIGARMTEDDAHYVIDHLAELLES